LLVARCMQLIPAMRLLVVVVVIAGCSTSPRERLDRLEEEVDIVCWDYPCNNVHHLGGTPPPAPVERALSCMNDALASGARAVATWSEYSFVYNVEERGFVFTIDHEVKAFFVTFDYDDHTNEVPACTGPFRISDRVFCSYDSAGQHFDVNALAWDGCP
jgi:hypothetical protein